MERLGNENLELHSQNRAFQARVDSLTNRLNEIEKNLEIQRQIANRHMEIIAKYRIKNGDEEN